MFNVNRIQVSILSYREYPRLKCIGYVVRYVDVKNGRSFRIELRRPFGYNISKENLLDTFAAMICAGISDVSNYKEFYENEPGYVLSEKDFLLHKELYKKSVNFFGYRDESGFLDLSQLYSFVSNYYDWLDDEY